MQADGETGRIAQTTPHVLGQWMCAERGVEGTNSEGLLSSQLN
jgi:hypothetical protein